MIHLWFSKIKRTRKNLRKEAPTPPLCSAEVFSINQDTLNWMLSPTSQNPMSQEDQVMIQDKIKKGPFSLSITNKTSNKITRRILVNRKSKKS